jgi:hypothetical protein
LDAAYRHAELAVWHEVAQSLVNHPRVWASGEEGAMVLREEVDELWDEIKRNQTGCALVEATQVAAMAVRFIADLCSLPGSAQQRCRDAAADARQARSQVGPRRLLASSHEAFGFLRREYDQLWAGVTDGGDVRVPAGRVAAMAVRFIAEISSAAMPVRGDR